MLKQLFVNLTILISFVSVGGQLLKDKPMNSTISRKIVGGVVGGIVGTILMIFSIHATDTTIVDLRNVAIVVVALYGGIVSSLIAGIIITVNRILLFGINISSLTAILTIMSTAVLCGLISKTNTSFLKKFIYMNIGQIFIFYTAMTFLVQNKETLFDIYIYYGLMSLGGGIIIYLVSEYIRSSNNNYRLLKEMANKDFLTGLNNVRQFDLMLNNYTIQAKEKKEKLSLLLIDIDYFKKINDTYGHPDGDKILKQLGELLNKSTRSIDIVSRNGGEEFSVILPDCPNDKALEIAERIRTSVDGHSFIISDHREINITVSIGVATYPDTVIDTDEIIDKADTRLYEAKHNGRNLVCG